MYIIVRVQDSKNGYGGSIFVVGLVQVLVKIMEVFQTKTVKGQPR